VPWRRQFRRAGRFHDPRCNAARNSRCNSGDVRVFLGVGGRFDGRSAQDHDSHQAEDRRLRVALDLHPRERFGILVGQETAIRPDGTQPPVTTKPAGTVVQSAPAPSVPEEESEDTLKRRLVDENLLRLEANRAFYEEGRIPSMFSWTHRMT